MERAVCNILCNDMQPLRRVTGRRVVQGEAKAAAGKNKQTDALYIKASHKRRDYLKNKRNKYGIGWMNGHHW